jgi:Tol biopolymer transport system component
MYRSIALALLALAVPAATRAVTFTQVTHCCSEREFGVTEPSWSSDANRIAVTVANDYAGYEVWVAIAAVSPTGMWLPYHYPPSNFTSQATWAPDAERYVCQWGDGTWVPSIGLLLVDGTDALIPLTLGSHAHPAWSPDGGTIAFSDLADGNVWTVPATGGMPMPVTMQGGAQPSWSANSTHVVYTSAGDLWSIPATGGMTLQLTSGPANDTQPACAPNGQWIAFTSDRNGNEDLFVISITGGAAIQITNDPAADRHPSWAPGSDRIAFESTRSGHPNLWIASDLPDFTIGVEQRTWSALKHRYRGMTH